MGKREVPLARPMLLLSIFGLAAALTLLAGAGPAAAKGGHKPVWLCKPGLADNPCEPGLSTTLVSPTGEPARTIHPKQKQQKFDCFYVYPTVSDDDGSNSDLSIDPEERSIALYQASRYSQYCRVYAPMYRQLTLKAINGDGGVTAEAQAKAYGDVLSAWRYYLKHYNRGRGIVLIGHSQGAGMLEQLIADQIDHKRREQKRIISAIVLGGNVVTKEGKEKGGQLRSLDACKRARQTGCVMAFSTFNEPVPDDALFGRPGGFFGGNPKTQDVLCTNPAALGGGKKAPLDAVMPTEPFAPGTTIGIATTLVGFPQPSSDPGTTYYESRDAYTGRCSSANDANALEVRAVNGAPDLKPIPDATWGLHLVDANIALGNLVDVVHKQARAYAKHARKRGKAHRGHHGHRGHGKGKHHRHHKHRRR